jgi:hypothetical protein
MTRERIFGSDTEFCSWMRECKQLPAYSNDFGFVASDNDVTVHRYMTCVDGVGTREVQALMQIEVKTRKGKPSQSQIDTLSKLNLFSNQKTIDGVVIRYFGVFVLVMSGTTPEDSKELWWGVIPKGKTLDNASDLQFKKINKQTLISLLRFDLHPVNMSLEPFRRHHLTKEVVLIETTPLGFECEVKLVNRS